MTRYVLRFSGLALIAVLGLAACAQAPEPQAQRDIRFTHLGQQSMALSAITLASAYRAPLTAPNLDHEIKPDPQTALSSWAQDRLLASGRGLRGQFVVENAAITREGLKTDKGITGLFKTEQAEKFVINLQARFDVMDASGAVVARARAAVQRFQTAPEGINLNQRDDLLFNLIEVAMADFDKEMMTQMAKHTGAYLR